MTDWPAHLVEWHEFYTYVGTAAATLVGLTFVVITLSPGTLSTREDAVRAFTTPIVAFFSTIVVISVIMLVPRLNATVHAGVFAIVGVIGIGYMISIDPYGNWRKNELGFDDLYWYGIFPGIAYFALIVAAYYLWRMSDVGLYIAAAAMLMFVIIGIRNAWDVVIAVAKIATRRDHER